MSELKAYIAPTPDGTGLADYYLKSEADKVIAEKDAEIERLEILCANYRHDCDNLAISNEQVKRAASTLLKKMNHHKYKRCLAMAKRYEFESRYYDLLTKVEASYLLSNPHNVHKYERKSFLSKVLCIRFRELAEKFKEAK